MAIPLRIKNLIDKNNLTISAFEKKIGSGNAVIVKLLQRNSNPSGDIMLKILQSFPEVDANWLITGKGSMYLAENTTQQAPCTHCAAHRRTIQDLQDLAALYRDKVALLEEKLAICEKKAPPCTHPPAENKK